MTHHPSAPLLAPEPWTVRLVADPSRSAVAPAARTAYAAWQAVGQELGNPAFGDVECGVETVPPPAPPPVIAEIVAALAEGPGTLKAIRNRVARAGRRHLSTAEVLLAVEAGAVRFNHLSQRYEATR